MPGYQTIPVYQAAQAVQKSAYGYAYQQYAQTGAQLAADYITTPHAVTCWYSPAAQAASQNVSAQAEPERGGQRALRTPSASRAPGQSVTRITRARSGPSVTVRPGAGRAGR